MVFLALSWALHPLSAIAILSETPDLRGCSPVIFLPPVSSWMVRKRFTAFCSSSSDSCHESLMCAAACHTQGKTAWTEIKMKSLYRCMPPWQPFNRTYLLLFLFHVLFVSWQLVQRCLQTLLCWTNAINTCYYMEPKWKLGQHLLAASREVQTCWTETGLTAWTSRAMHQILEHKT